jgi:hypothetical protein
MNTRFWGLSEECGRASHDAHISESRYGAPAFVSGWRVGVLPFVVTAVDGPPALVALRAKCGGSSTSTSSGSEWATSKFIETSKAICGDVRDVLGMASSGYRHSRQRFARGANNPPFAINLQTHP